MGRDELERPDWVEDNPCYVAVMGKMITVLNRLLADPTLALADQHRCRFAENYPAHFEDTAGGRAGTPPCPTGLCTGN